MKTTQKEATKKEFDLKEALVLWRKEGKNGEYLTGFVSENKDMKLIAFFNTDKKNPKEPDIRVFESIKQEDGTYKKSETEVASLWTNVDKNDKKYLTGSTNEKEKLVGWFGQEHQEMRPYVRVYFQKD